MTIANPIYDSVFKFLMEDNRVARTILSALLKKDIVKLDMRPHEYTNSRRGTISMFRVDFAATIRETDGKEHLILIEVQKTWLETETLRFRQYLGVQYQRKENIDSGSKEGYALPMVAVYILGHKVGDIEEPVLYVHHEAYDYNEQRVTQGLPDPFVDSLTHESIIVQIPRLRGQVNNRLDKILSVFDQSRHTSYDEHLLKIDDSLYSNDKEMEPILHRLLMAASDADMRHEMNVEDEFYSAIERRDTELLQRDHLLAEQKVRIAEQKVRIEEQKELLAKNEELLAQKNNRLAVQEALLRKAMQAMLDLHLPEEVIAAQLGIDVETVNRLRD